MAGPWTIENLAEALPDALAEERVVMTKAENVLVVRFPDAGDTDVVMTTEGDQMLASTLLWKRSEQKDPSRFEEDLLRTHKMLPLSTFGITKIAGEDWYELFGALSASSTLDNVVLELKFLVQNALDIAEARDA